MYQISAIALEIKMFLPNSSQKQKQIKKSPCLRQAVTPPCGLSPPWVLPVSPCLPASFLTLCVSTTAMTTDSAAKVLASSTHSCSLLTLLWPPTFASSYFIQGCVCVPLVTPVLTVEFPWLRVPGCQVLKIMGSVTSGRIPAGDSLRIEKLSQWVHYW